MLAFLADQRSLKTKITFVTLAILVSGIWSLAAYTSRDLQENLQHLLSNQQSTTAEFVAGQVNDELNNRFVALRQYIHGRMTPDMVANPDAMQIRLEESPIIQEVFNGGLFVVGSDGVAIASVPASLGRVGTSYMERDSVMAALQEGKATVGKPVMGKKLRTPIFVMAAPVRDAQGRIIGALAGVTDLSKPNFLQKITNGRYGKTGGYMLVAQQHQLIVTASDETLIMQKLPLPGVSPLIGVDNRDYGESAISVDSLGVEALTTAKSVPVAGWTLLVTLPVAEAFAPLLDMQRHLLFATIILTLLAGGLMWWMLKRQLAPMLATTRILAAQSETSGPLQALPVTSRDEIGVLVSAFNRLMAILEARQEALDNSNRRFRNLNLSLQDNALYIKTIMDTALDGIITIDSCGTITSFNQSAETIFGYSADKVIGCNVNMLMPEPHRSAHNGYLHDYLTKGSMPDTRQEIEVEGRRNGGSAFPMSLAISATSHKGQPLFIGLVRDITEQKRVERMKAEFVSTVSHELRTPLTSISGSLALLAGGVLGDVPETFKPILDIAHKNSQRLTLLINDLLDMEKLMAGKAHFEFQVQLLMPLVEQALESVKSYSDQFRVTYRIEERADGVQVRVDGNRLQQVLFNFLSNAAKFSPAGEIVSIKVKERGNRVRVEIMDLGPGVPEAFQSRLFQKFSQADSSNCRQKGGTGLGLAISKELIERMQGLVGYRSGQGQATCFYCELPLASIPVSLTAS
jgi:PAS domain S-box-containing protein